MKIYGTTIFGIIHNGESAMGGDGQVTLGNSVVMKHRANKIRKLYHGKILAGFAGSVADAFTLFESFEKKLETYEGNIARAAVELAKEWRSDKVLRKLEAMLVVMDRSTILLISGTGEVIEPDDGIVAIGSGGNFALSAGRALKRYAKDISAKEITKASLEIASEICVYTNDHLTIEVLD